MARIALGATLLFLLVTCFFAFETKSKITGYAADSASAKSAIASANQEAAKDKALLRSAQEDAAKAKKDVQDVQTQLDTANASLTAANTQHDTDQQTIKDLQAKAGSGPTPPPAPVVNGPTQEEYNKAIAQLKDKEAEVAELTDVKNSMNGKVIDAEKRADDLQKTVDHYVHGTMRNGLEGEVLAVNPGWNFVVLSIGDHQGAVTNAEMIIERGGSQIGKVRISSVEPSTSVADIIPGSLSRGVQVQPGDRVIFPGS